MAEHEAESRNKRRVAPTFILVLAIFALAMQGLDLISALRMIGSHGLSSELNPLARAIFMQGGPVGLTAIKMGVIVAAVWLFIRVAREGRVRLAAAALVLSALVGAFGYYSNQV